MDRTGCARAMAAMLMPAVRKKLRRWMVIFRIVINVSLSREESGRALGQIPRQPSKQLVLLITRSTRTTIGQDYAERPCKSGDDHSVRSNAGLCAESGH